MKKSIFIVFVILICTSCNYSNKFYFDLENQTINACSSKGLKYVNFRNDIKKINFTLKWEDTLKSIPKIIKLADLQEGYIIDKGWEEERINSKNILLAKSTTYIIVTYGVDVASYDVMITTDANGKVVSTSHGSCD